MKTIPLTRGMVALVDDEDYAELAPHRWYAQRGRNTWYAARRPQNVHVLMHQEVMGGKGIDHIDGNGLNNQRSNLRFATQAQNSYNSRLSRRNTSGHTGVSWMPLRRKWQVHIQAEGKNHFLGHFATLEEAVAVRADAAAIYHGEFRR